MALRVKCSCGNEAIATGDVAPGTYVETFYVDACEECNYRETGEEG